MPAIAFATISSLQVITFCKHQKSLLIVIVIPIPETWVLLPGNVLEVQVFFKLNQSQFKIINDKLKASVYCFKFAVLTGII